MKAFQFLLAVSLIFVIVPTIAQDEEYRLDETYSIDPNGTIELYTDDANIRITGSNRKNVHVYIYRKVITRGIKVGRSDFDIDVRSRGGDLIITEDRESSYNVMSIGYQRVDYEISIEAPSTVALLLKGDDDDYDIRNIDGSISMDLDDGDARLTNCDGNHFEFDLDDGDLELDGGFGFLYLKADDGDVFIRDGRFTEISATLDDGDIIIETTLADNGDYSFRCDDGNIDFKVLGGGGEFEIRHDDASITSSEAFELLEKDDHETILRMSSGTARVRMRADDARVRLSSL